MRASRERVARSDKFLHVAIRKSRPEKSILGEQYHKSMVQMNQRGRNEVNFTCRASIDLHHLDESGPWVAEEAAERPPRIDRPWPGQAVNWSRASRVEFASRFGGTYAR